MIKGRYVTTIVGLAGLAVGFHILPSFFKREEVELKSPQTLSDVFEMKRESLSNSSGYEDVLKVKRESVSKTNQDQG